MEASTSYDSALPGRRRWMCQSIARADYNSDACYVTKLVAREKHVAACLSGNTVKLYSKSAHELHLAGDLQASGRVWDLCAPPGEPHVLLGACEGSQGVLAWDVRCRSVAQRFATPPRGCNVLDVSGAVVAAGCGEALAFWDRRAAKRLAAFEDSFGDGVAALRFVPGTAQLVSGCEDGMLAVFDLTTFDEEECFQAGLNVGTSVAELGLYGHDYGRAWVRSGTESLHLWEWRHACDEGGAGGQGVLSEAADAREQFTAACQGVLPGAEVEYLIACAYDAASDALVALGGTARGAVGVCPVLPSRELRLGPACGALEGGHSDVVRAALFDGEGGVLTGGEDGRVCVWAAEEVKPREAVGKAETAGARARRSSPY